MPDKLTSDITLIAGPTASGKTAAALALARATGAEIVNADAMQVYREIPVLSAQPSAGERGAIPHHLFGYLSVSEKGSAGDWARRVRETLHAIRQRGNPAIVVGGTGLYFRALTDGLSAIPPIPPDVRRAVADRYDEWGADRFRAKLLEVDPAMSRLEPGDRQRHVRAMEVWTATGRALSDWQQEPAVPIAENISQRIIIEPPRDALYARIDARFRAMIDAGALDEARTLASLELDPDLPALKALGARDLMDYLSGAQDLEAAIAAAQMKTRRFAKRQMTWFRNQTPDWPRVAVIPDIASAMIRDPAR